MIRLRDVVLDAGTQMRVNISQEKIEEYKEAMLAGEEFPQLVVYKIGERFVLADGFHRIAAMMAKGQEWAEVDLREGSLHDAILFALKANARHGLPRTRADKRKSVNYCLDHPEMGKLVDAQVASLCDVSREFVRLVRAERREPPKAPAAPVEKSNVGNEDKSNVGKEEPQDFDMRDDAIDQLSSELETTKAKLAAKALDEDEREEALAYMEELREENKMLRQQIEAVKRSRDQYMAENAQLKRQVAMQVKKMKAAGI